MRTVPCFMFCANISSLLGYFQVFTVNLTSLTIIVLTEEADTTDRNVSPHRKRYNSKCITYLGSGAEVILVPRI